MGEKLKEQLIASGCTIIKETDNSLIVSCPTPVLEKGLVVESSGIGIRERRPNEAILVIRKKEE